MIGCVDTFVAWERKWRAVGEPWSWYAQQTARGLPQKKEGLGGEACGPREPKGVNGAKTLA